MIKKPKEAMLSFAGAQHGSSAEAPLEAGFFYLEEEPEAASLAGGKPGSKRESATATKLAARSRTLSKASLVSNTMPYFPRSMAKSVPITWALET